VSYLAVLPAAALLLLGARRWSGGHFVTALGAAWGIKLVVTSALYFALAAGTAHVPVAGPLPATVPSASSVTPAADYRAAAPGFPRGELRGTVVEGGSPVAGAVVFLDKPLAGLPVAAPGSVTLDILDARYSAPAYLVPAGAELFVASANARLHTLHLFDAGRAVLNMPVTAAAGPRRVGALEPGIYEARCDTHDSERAAVVVVDHPYATVTDATGELALEGVPAGSVTVVVVTDAAGSSPGRRLRARVEAGLTTTLNIDLSTPEVAEERL